VEILQLSFKLNAFQLNFLSTILMSTIIAAIAALKEQRRLVKELTDAIYDISSLHPIIRSSSVMNDGIRLLVRMTVSFTISHLTTVFLTAAF
jgi:hypothetical protein